MDRTYYSTRTGRHRGEARLDLDMLKQLFNSEYHLFLEEGSFQRDFGYYCVDDGQVPGTLGLNPGLQVFIALKKDNLWPVNDHINSYEEDDVFDMMEFLYDHVADGVSGRFHSFSNCGMHYSRFDRDKGREKWREAMNRILSIYSNGFELNEDGEVQELAPSGMEPIFSAPVPGDDQRISSRIDAAVSKFRRHRASPDERRDAVRDLADVLEFMREDVKSTLATQDEKDLFNLANNFGIRHHNERQKADYDQDIWLNWMFYFYLSTVHACLRLKDRAST